VLLHQTDSTLAYLGGLLLLVCLFMAPVSHWLEPPQFPGRFISDAQVLNALETAKQRRTKTGSPQPIGTSYLAPIVAELCNPNAQRQPSRHGRYAEDAQQMAELVAHADAILASMGKAEIDMGVIHASYGT